MSLAPYIVDALLLENDPEEFMNSLMRDPQGVQDLFQSHEIKLAGEELDTLKAAVIRRTAQIAPTLIEKGIISPRQIPLLAKYITFYLSNKHYDPRHWHGDWQQAARRISRFLNSNVSWSSTRTPLDEV